MYGKHYFAFPLLVFNLESVRTKAEWKDLHLHLTLVRVQYYMIVSACLCTSLTLCYNRSSTVDGYWIEIIGRGKFQMVEEFNLSQTMIRIKGTANFSFKFILKGFWIYVFW